jgi:hypothetical protein
MGQWCQSATTWLYIFNVNGNANHHLGICFFLYIRESDQHLKRVEFISDR